MSKAEQKIVQYLNEAHAMEQGLTRVLQSQIAMTPRGTYRGALEKHLKETHQHAQRLERRLAELRPGRSPLELGVGLVESVAAQALALSKTPLDLLRGSGGEEKVLKNAKDTCAAEALEIATYTAIERLARSVGDTDTAKLAVSNRADEQRMLDKVIAELPTLTEAVVRAQVRGKGSYDLTRTGAADAARGARRSAEKTTRKGAAKTRSGARQARKVPGVARAEGRVKGAVASEPDLPIRDYDKLAASDIHDRLPGLSQVDLAKVEAYERRSENRTTILGRIATLKAAEPWPGYDELTVEEVRSTLVPANEERARTVRSYERDHKNREGVLEAAEHELAGA